MWGRKSTLQSRYSFSENKIKKSLKRKTFLPLRRLPSALTRGRLQKKDRTSSKKTY